MVGLSGMLLFAASRTTEPATTKIWVNKHGNWIFVGISILIHYPYPWNQHHKKVDNYIKEVSREIEEDMKSDYKIWNLKPCLKAWIYSVLGIQWQQPFFGV